MPILLRNSSIALLLFLNSAIAQTIGPPPNTSGSSPCSAFGTIAGTCAQGNDSRITGAVQNSSLGTGIATALGNATNATGGPVTAVTGCTSWTPTDQSGASLVFTSVSTQFCQYGNLVIAYGTLTYPTTADASAAKLSLPVAVPNQSYAAVPGQWFDRAGAGDILFATQGTSQAAVIAKAAGSAITNANLSTKVINFFIMYPAQ